MSYKYALNVDDLSKCYQIYRKPSDRLKQMMFRGKRRFYEEFWALNGITFELKKGETLGIIGSNGSGKSTLLQMICGTLNPTRGRVETNGRVAALLELGAGFNPDFSGVDNVYLSASLYGLTKKEISKRFDKIAEFADIGDHINQPVKTYSSGMYVRLAFAVIANVDADILVVDEALAVGDAIFTQKCMSFIERFKKKGALIFVSHDIGLVQRLCDRVLWLKNGKSNLLGPAKRVSEEYLRYTLQKIYGDGYTLESSKDIEPDEEIVAALPNYAATIEVYDNLGNSTGWKTGHSELVSISIGGKHGTDNLYNGGEIVQLTIKAKVHEELKNPIVGFLFRDRLGQDLFGENTLSASENSSFTVPKGSVLTGVFKFKMPYLRNGDYTIMASVAEGDQNNNVQHHWANEALLVRIFSSNIRHGILGVESLGAKIGIKNELS